MKSLLILNYINSLVITGLFISIFAFIVPNIIILSTHWDLIGIYTKSLIISYYSYVIAIILFRRVCIYCSRDQINMLSSIFTFIIQMTGLLIYIIICGLIIFDNLNIFRSNPIYVCLASQLVYYLIIFGGALLYLVILIVINIFRPHYLIRLINNLTLFNYGFTKKEIKKHINYTYDMIHKKLSRFDKIHELDYYDAYCYICKVNYEDTEEVQLFKCGHHCHSECGVKILKNVKSCCACNRLITLVEDYVY